MSPKRPLTPLPPPAWLSELGIPADCISSQTAVGDDNARFRIQKAPGDEVWCVRVDGCWLPDNLKKVDYLFYCSSAAGAKKVVLVELKGSHLPDALAQIRSTLRQLCKLGVRQGIHKGMHRNSPGHEPTQSGGVHAYVILSKFRSTVLNQREIQDIAKQYQVVITPKSQLLSVSGVDRLP